MENKEIDPPVGYLFNEKAYKEFCESCKNYENTMTNEKIREKIVNFAITGEQPAGALNDVLEQIQHATRKDERERVIGEIEKWADGELNMPSRYYSELIKLLNKLKNISIKSVFFLKIG